MTEIRNVDLALIQINKLVDISPLTHLFQLRV